jgi:TRAP-type mannitol/chloroaromatic compound transport system permease small subunit
MANPFVTGLLAITLGVIVLANVFIPTVKNVSTTGWTDGEIALWSVVGLIAVMGMVYAIAQIFGLA